MGGRSYLHAVHYYHEYIKKGQRFSKVKNMLFSFKAFNKRKWEDYGIVWGGGGYAVLCRLVVQQEISDRQLVDVAM